ncbi:MAG: hypothetical protein AABW85_03010, partial [archaeon]
KARNWYFSDLSEKGRFIRKHAKETVEAIKIWAPKILAQRKEKVEYLETRLGQLLKLPRKNERAIERLNAQLVLAKQDLENAVREIESAKRRLSK